MPHLHKQKKITTKLKKLTLQEKKQKLLSIIIGANTISQEFTLQQNKKMLTHSVSWILFSIPKSMDSKTQESHHNHTGL